jgi:hypothetical protein
MFSLLYRYDELLRKKLNSTENVLAEKHRELERKMVDEERKHIFREVEEYKKLTDALSEATLCAALIEVNEECSRRFAILQSSLSQQQQDEMDVRDGLVNSMKAHIAQLTSTLMRQAQSAKLSHRLHRLHVGLNVLEDKVESDQSFVKEVEYLRLIGC